MGFSLNLFITPEIEEDFLCSICRKVLQDAIVLKPCKHAFCRDCIRDWRTTSNSCPVDQIAITGEKEPPGLFLNLLNNLKLRCPFAPGRCLSILPLRELPHHRNWCRPARSVSNVAQNLDQPSLSRGPPASVSGDAIG